MPSELEPNNDTLPCPIPFGNKNAPSFAQQASPEMNAKLGIGTVPIASLRQFPSWLCWKSCPGLNLESRNTFATLPSRNWLRLYSKSKLGLPHSQSKKKSATKLGSSGRGPVGTPSL